jgi:hypothetical protein
LIDWLIDEWMDGLEVQFSTDEMCYIYLK